jgi:DedD protein
MSAENKKLLWIGIAVSAFVLALAVAGVFFFAPKKGAALAPASLNATEAPKATDPQDFLSAPPPLPEASTDRGADGDVIVIYGDKPQDLGQGSPDASALGTAAAAASSGAAGTAASPAKAPATGAAKPAASAAKPVTATKPAATSSTAAPKKPGEQYWIQAAAFTSRGKADELKEGLSKQGLAALVTVADVNGKTWYRVRIGPYASSKEATGWLSKVKGIAGCADAGIWKTGSTGK